MISVDGRSESKWVTPFTIPGLQAGSHQVVISKEGYDDYQQSVNIEGGRTNSLGASLSVPRGEVTIITTPPGFDVLIDGKLIGPSPAHANLVAGSHNYTVRRPGAEPYENTFKVTSGAIMNVKVNLGGEENEIVAVNTIPPGATVSEDGNPVAGLTPTTFRLTAGQHTLVISYSGRSVQRVIQVKIGEPVEVRVDMRHQ
jgi:hypothetical protein